MERTIKVTGRGKVTVKPDVIQLNIRMEEIFPEYEKTLNASGERTEALRAALAKAGFEPKDLKTTYFNISTEYEGYYDEHNNWRNKFIGYKFNHSLYIKFANDNELLGKAFFALANSGVKSELSVSYTVSDPEPAKDELLRSAVKDSRTKAAALAEAAGVSLGEIMNIDYSWGEINIWSRPVDSIACGGNAKLMAREESCDMDIVADDINLEDNVTVVWEIR